MFGLPFGSSVFSKWFISSINSWQNSGVNTWKAKTFLAEGNMKNMTLVLDKKERYTQGEIDLLFNAIVPKIIYGFSVYAPSVSDLAAVQALYIC